MKKIVMIHTIQKTIGSVGEMIKNELEKEFPGEVQIYHMLDERFGEVDKAQSLEERHEERLHKLFHMVKAAEWSNPDVILVACSTLSPVVRQLRREVVRPLVAIDERALEYCAEQGKKITIFATSDNPIEPVVSGLHHIAEQKGKKSLETEVVLCKEALPYLLRMEEVRYREEVLGAAQALKGKEMIYLAQGSTAVLQKEIAGISGCEVVSSIGFCVKELKLLLQGKDEVSYV